MKVFGTFNGAALEVKRLSWPAAGSAGGGLTASLGWKYEVFRERALTS